MISKLTLKAKESLFKFGWLVSSLVIGTGIYFWKIGEINNEIVLAVIGGSFGFLYFIQQQKLAESTFFREVFIDFNSRYDKLNNDLSKITNDTTQIQDNVEMMLIDYFNLCAEEYLIYTKGYIPTIVWESWVNGMNYYWEIPVIRKIWIEELSKNSYYNFDPDRIFKSQERKKTDSLKVAA